MVKEPIIKIDKPHFIVKLYEDLLEVDLKEGARKELEDAVEAHPAIRESIGILFQTIVPLDVALSAIDSAEVNKKGQLQIVIPLRRDIVIPLESNESKKLAEKINELIPIAKFKDAEKAEKMREIEKRPRTEPSGII
jgi:hypothetical protein